jgi:NADPH:quinone reductase-like Zn-dependent oxidoreductase
MKAMVYTAHGPPDVLHLAEMAQPTPKDHDVLIRVYATAVTSGDCRLRKADPFGVRFLYGLRALKRTVLGSELAGEIEAAGTAVTRFKPGDQVFGFPGKQLGTYAEYACLPEDGALALKPANLTYEEAAVLPFGGNTALCPRPTCAQERPHDEAQS